MIRLFKLWWTIFSLLAAVFGGKSLDLQGPLFIHEPSHRVEFSNNSGGHVDCTGHGSPQPEVEWIMADGTPVHQVPELRLLYSNGSLVFPAFSGERYRHDVHAAMYRCRLRSSVGTVISRDVHVRAVLKQKYEVQVYDEYVISGNTAVLRCQIPTYVAEHVMVTSWLQDGSVNIYPNTDIGGKYIVLPNGDLHINKAGPSDGYKSYACRTINRLTGEIHTSTYPGRVIVTEPKGSVQPRVTVEKHTIHRTSIGDDVTLACVAQGHPVPSYRWYREEQDQLIPILYSEHVKLISDGLVRIYKSRLDDHGKYVCVVNNSAGEETVQVTLIVTAPLSAHIQPQIQVIDVGKDASFQCISNGYPQNKIIWLHNGNPITDDNRIDISSNSDRLRLKPLQKDDSGMYQCFVSNEWDQAQAIAELDLGDASPEILYWFSEQTLQPGPMVSLKCVATGNPPPQFTWTLDGFPVPDNFRYLVGQYVTVHDDVISHVNITNIKEEDGGEYSCTAHNSIGKISRSARINVYGLPYIREMSKIIGIAGKDLVIKCPAAGYPLESIIWEKDGQVLPINRRQRVYANGTLIIEQTQQNEDAGTYTCQAQNRQKNLARRDVEIQILVPPKILPMSAMTNLLREGMRAALSCQIMEGDLPIAFRWERNGIPIVNTGTFGHSDRENQGAITRRLDEYSASLIIEKINSEHSGNYTCIASNVAGSESFTVPLTVNVPPKWTTEPTDTNIAAGQKFHLQCQASGYPTPTITWKKAIGDNPGEYKDLNFEPNIQIYHNGTLTISHVSKENEGHYLCEAKNQIGSGVSKVIFLKVNAPAHFTQKNKQLQVVKGEKAHIQCTALGDHPIEIIWKMAGQIIESNTDERFTIREQILDDRMVSELGITHTHRQDTSIYSCHANNAYGEDEMTIQLIVQEVPEYPKNIRLNDQQSKSIQLSWTQPYAGNSPIINYIIQHKLSSESWSSQPLKLTVPGTETSATVKDLRPANTYQMRIIAENRLGQSEPSEIIQVNTLEEVPSGAPQDIRAEAKSSTELVVTWEPPSREFWNGNLLGYYVWYQEILDNSPTAMPTFFTTQNSKFKTVEIRPHFGGETILQGLLKYTVYSVVVQAYNARGSGPSSEPISARTMEDAPSSPPENVQCTTQNSQTVRVSWEPPATEGRNGVIQGYKISHHPVEDWYDKNDQVIKITTQVHTTIPNLRKFTNYSISVLSFTNSGDGVRSFPVYCHTDEDVPSAPADIKAVISSSNKILVSWLPPKNSNGHLVSYTFYTSIVEEGKQENIHKRVLNPSTELHEIIRLQDSATYRFWVTASTRIGEGEITKVETIEPSNIVAARIVSFNRKIISAWKENINLPCHKVGIPEPVTTWHQQGKEIDSNGRIEITAEGTLKINEAQKTDEGNYTCTVENQYGKDEIIYMVKIKVPPDPPILTVVNVYADSLHLEWKDQHHGGSPILGYVINYKREHGDWEELQVDARADSHILRNLFCGTRYQLYITAFNQIGTGLPCDIVSTYTKGTVPVKPKQSQMLTMNTTVATIWLDSWGDGGCGILYFIVEYRQAKQSQWMLSSNQIRPTERVFSVIDLKPGTKYQLKITAINNAGSTAGLYNFSTLTPEGVISDVQIPVTNSNDSAMYGNMKVAIPIIGSLLFLFILLIAVYLIRRKRIEELAQRNRVLGESPSVAQLQNKRNRDQQYLAVRINKHQQQVAVGGKKHKNSDADYIDDVCPYATFQLTKPAYSESSYSGNVYSGPYHSVKGSFVYHDIKPPPSDKCKLGLSKEPEYTKVRRKGGRLRDPNGESQESDNLGSTDSEVKKILTLHLPISEYDTLGSDSEIEASRSVGSLGASQELISYRHRPSRDVNDAIEGSSSSSESSPMSANRKSYPTRKNKSKNSMLSKRHMRSSSGYSSHNDETTFSISHTPSLNEHIHPPTRFSDIHPNDLSEVEYNKSHASGMGMRKGSRGTSIGKFTRDTFQINV